jgi:DNA-binding transcriptional ArsR family regulator
MFSEISKLKLFFEDPHREWAVREYARRVKIAPATASKLLTELAKQGILIKRKERIYHLYKANFQSNDYKDLKVYYNVRKIRESGIVDYLSKKFPGKSVLLTGSWSTGQDHLGSSIIFAVIANENKNLNLSEFEKKLNQSIKVKVHSNFVAGVALVRGEQDV